jgi:RNA polymerase sigma-70 factor (ECF subfamily)
MLSATAASGSDAPAAAERAARRSYGRLVAFLAARTRDVAGAEDALSDAFEAALQHWGVDGVPDNPEAWLLTVARRKMIDAIRGHRRGEEAAAHLEWLAALAETDSGESGVPDRRLELMFACAHPAIEPAARSPLMLQAVLGFDAATIAAAFLVAPATMSQRLVRAKAKIRLAGIGLQLPEHDRLSERLDAVLSAIYAAYTEGWSDAGTEPRRRHLAQEAIWLARLVATLMPREPEALGLLALMLYSSARREARRDGSGAYVPLADQDPALWDRPAIDEAEGLLHLAGSHGVSGRYQLEAAVQSAHIQRMYGGHVDWVAIERLYEALCALTGSPVAAVNHAVALAQTRGAAAGLAELDALLNEGQLADYQPYWAARADLLARCGDFSAAKQACDRAVQLERDEAVRQFLVRRAAAWP